MTEPSYSVAGVARMMAMVPYEVAMALISKFIGTNIPLTDWAEHIQSSAHMFQIPMAYPPDLAIYSLDDGACQAVLAFP